MRNYFISSILLLLCSFYFISCENDPYGLDVSQSDIKLKVHRFDQDLKQIDISNLSKSRQTLYQKYGDFYSIYLEQIIRIGSASDTSTLILVENFKKDSMISAIQSEIETKFSPQTVDIITKNLESAFKRYHKLFPDKKIPEVIFSNTGFNIGIAVLEQQLSIGLDFYIGAESELLKFLPMDQFPMYEKEKMERDYLEADAVKYWIETEIFDSLDKGDLLNQIIKQGKLMYLMDILFYKQEDRILMRYSKEEYDWALENQENIWHILGNQKTLFGTRTFDNQKWVNNGPFTNVQGIPDNSPARLGVWIGWQMVNDFMEDHPEMDIYSLLLEKDNQKIMRSYDPRN